MTPAPTKPSAHERNNAIAAQLKAAVASGRRTLAALKPAITASDTSLLIREVEAYLSRYVTFPDPLYALVGATWAAATYLWPSFDAFGYLVITSDTKRSGKTRFSELLSFVASNARNIAGMTPATIFRSIRDESPVLIMDEAETLNGESADVMRAVLNVGYRKGQTIPRMGKTGVEHWPAYCPKVFVLIGDVYDTLRDRAINVRMARSSAPQRFLYDVAKADGAALGERLKAAADESSGAILETYRTHAGLPYLQDRDEELWLPLFATLAVLAPDRLTDLTRIAADLSTEKTAPARDYISLLNTGAETAAQDAELAERLLADTLAVIGKDKHIATADLLPALQALPTGPWRKFRGTGLDAHDLRNLLTRFGVNPKNLSVGKGRKARRILKGYARSDVQEAIERLHGPSGP